MTRETEDILLSIQRKGKNTMNKKEAKEKAKEQTSTLFAIASLVTFLFGVPAFLMIILGYYSNGDENVRQLVHFEILFTCVSVFGYLFAYFTNLIANYEDD